MATIVLMISFTRRQVVVNLHWWRQEIQSGGTRIYNIFKPKNQLLKNALNASQYLMPMILWGTCYASGTLEGQQEVVVGLRYIHRGGFLASKASRKFLQPRPLD